MKILYALLLLPLTTFAHSGIPDLPPDATSADYRPYLSPVFSGVLAPALAMGERNLAWLVHINGKRSENDKLSFSSKETMRGYPIDQPNEYSPTLILKKLNDLKTALPRELYSVIFEGANFTDSPPVDTKTYLDWGRQLDRVYQSAARWTMMERWLPSLKMRRREDIRGYYFLSRLAEEVREQKLRTYPKLDAAEQKQIADWLSGMCFNEEDSLEDCQSEVNDLMESGADLNPYYQRREPDSGALYRSYFEIPRNTARYDFTWETSANGQSRLVAPFTDPGKPDVRHFVQFNVMDEWKWNGWTLDLPFTAEAGHPYIVFVPGATPNVNGLGGDRITMNSRQPLTEYDAQWTIRHEFGHVIGLPDCYVEFYVSETHSIVNYQIDVDNIMCSRKGHVKQINVDEIKRAYGSN